VGRNRELGIPSRSLWLGSDLGSASGLPLGQPHPTSPFVGPSSD